jgi:predicted Zn-dependent peptidase
MKHTKFTLSNGLRVISVPMDTPSVSVYVWAGVGSRYETLEKSGIAHFFEHIVFKGSKKRPTAKKISEAIDGFGGVLNAGTGKETTSFYVKAPVARVEDAMDVLADMVVNPLMLKSEVEREKGVIKSEIDMYEDLPMHKVGDIYDGLVFGGSSLGRNVLGKKETMEKITREDFVRYKKKYYCPKNLLVTVVGGVSTRKARELVKKYFDKLERGRVEKTKRFVSKQRRVGLEVFSKKTDQAHVLVGFLGRRHMHRRMYAEDVLFSILGGGSSSRFFVEVREKRGLCYAIKTYDDNYSDTGTFCTYVGTEPGKAPGALRVILREYEKMTSMKDCGVTKAEFRKAKEFLKGRFALDMESTASVSSFFGLDEMKIGKTRSFEDYIEGVEGVALDEVVALAKDLFVGEKLNLAVIGPFKGEGKFDSVIKSYGN